MTSPRGLPTMKTPSWLLSGVSPKCTLGMHWGRILRHATLVVLTVLIGCNTRQEDVQPTIEFTQVPPTSSGGSYTHGSIAGRVVGARPNQQIVLYAKAGPWWIQPSTNQPFIKIRSDRTWLSPTHLGTEYAALLVDAEFKPQNVIENLPKQGGQVAAVATVKGKPAPPAQSAANTLQFSGYEWAIRGVPSGRNGASHNYDPANARVDSQGFLHLKVTLEQGKWTCSEVAGTKSLGYGTYLLTVHDVSHLEPATIFNAFTWDDYPTDPHHREVGLEIGRWGDPARENARYIVQPFYVPANVSRFTVPPGQLTNSLHWEPGRASFQTFRGNTAKTKSRPIAEHVFTTGVPSAGRETLRMNFCVVENYSISEQHEAEIIIENFQYLP